MSDTQTIMCINSGSSSLKFHLYEMGPRGSAPSALSLPSRDSVEQPAAANSGERLPVLGAVEQVPARGSAEQLLARGAVEGIGHCRGRLWFKDHEGALFAEHTMDNTEQEYAIEQALTALSHKELPSIEAIGHRIVHGGPNHLAPEVLTPDLIADLREHTAWAPLHMPAGLRVIDALAAQRPGLPQVACFDTAFHARIPEIARRLPLPRRFFDQGVRRYGFHGLSYEYVLGTLGGRARGRVVMAHLGNGASMVACLDGRPLETTMGMTPLGGFMMGTRTGDIDPGVLLYLVRECGYEDTSLERLLDKESGLKGVSGETADMKVLVELRAAGHEAAAQAVEMFCYHARKAIGSLAAVLGGLDLLVFTGGIGENAPAVRALMCENLEHLGVALDPTKNEANAANVGAEGAACSVRVVHTNEDLMIARHTYALVFGTGLPEGGTS